MNAAALLAEVRARGAIVALVGSRLRIRPRGAIIDLEPEIRLRARELASLMPQPAVLDVPNSTAVEAHALRVVVDELRPEEGTVELRPGVRVVDVPLAIDGVLGDLAIQVRRYMAAVRSDHYLAAATEHGEQIEQLIENLAQLGCLVRVVGVH